MIKLLLAGATIVAIALNPAVRKHDPIQQLSCLFNVMFKNLWEKINFRLHSEGVTNAKLQLMCSLGI